MRTNLPVRWIAAAAVACSCITLAAQTPPTSGPAVSVPLDPKIAQYKRDLVAEIDGMKDFTQQMVDSVFSFGELGLPGVRDRRIPHRHPGEERLPHRARRRRHSDRVDGHVGLGQAGHRARLGHRRHSAGVAEAGRRLPRADHRRRAGPRRGAQLRHAAQRHRRARAQEGHGAEQAARHDPAVAGRRRGTARHQGVLRPRRRVQGRRRRALRARRHEPGRELGRRRRQRPGVGRIQLQGRERARRGLRRGAAARRSTPWS